MPPKRRKINPELEALRAEVRRKHRNATAKISRLNAKGIVIKGTSYDARDDVKKFATYTTKQLIAHAKRLDEFTQRKTAFVPGAGGAPLPKSKFERYKALEAQHNAIGDIRMNERGDFMAPGSGMSIRDREHTMRPDSVRAQGDVVNRPYSKIERSPENINGEAALDKLTRDMQRKLNRNFLPKQIRASRKQLDDMLDIIGNSELSEAARGLTAHQFDVLWNDTKFATDAGLIYGVMKMKAAGGKDRWYASVVEDYANDISEALEWAKTLPKTKPTQGGKKNSK